MDERTRKRLDQLPPEKRAAAEAALARLRTPEARTGRAAAAEAVEREVAETGGITTADGAFHKVKAPVVAEESAYALVAVGRALRDHRTAAGLSLDDVARESGVDQSAIAKIERGANPNPTVGTLARVAAAVGGRIAIAFEEDAPSGRSR